MTVVTTVATQHGYNDIVTTVVATVSMTVVTTVATQHGYNDIVTTVIATVVTNVVTTVVMENRMPARTIFFLMSDARCWAMIFF